MGKKIDLTGQRFGRLVVVEDSGKRNSNGSIVWICLCDCGKKTETIGSHLKRRSTKSCGCLTSENAKELQSKFDYSKMVEKSHRWIKENDSKQGTRLSQLMQKKSINNTSGYKGVTWDKSRKKWVAQMKFQGRHMNLGRFPNKQDAINARKEAEEKYFQPVLEKYGKEMKEN